jgi:DNA-binding transcriptional ArsR family regulator
MSARTIRAANRRQAVLRELSALETLGGGALPFHVRYFRGSNTEELVRGASSLEMIVGDLRRLADAGLVEVSRDGQQKRYRLTDEGRAAVARDQR